MIFEQLKKMFTPVQNFKGMPGIDEVKLNIPDNAQYVTLVEMSLQSKQMQAADAEFTRGGMITALSTDDGTVMTSAYMLHDGDDLSFIHDRQKIFSIPLGGIESLQSVASIYRAAHYGGEHAGFVVNLNDGRSILVSTPMPVATDATTNFKTIGRMTDLTGGWAKQLKPYGVQTFY